MNSRISRCVVAVLFGLAAAGAAVADGSVPGPVAQRADVYFSPRGHAQDAVVQMVNEAHASVRVAAYALTSAPVTKALIDAKRRGVDVAVLADHRFNVEHDRSGTGIAALNALALAGVSVRTVSKFPIFHDKFIVTDGLNVQTGSFNYSSAAQVANSENVLILWNSPGVARQYLEHWSRRAEESQAYQPLTAKPRVGRDIGDEG